jgi:hypothetical protein
MRERGQASVEMVACCVLLAMAATAAVQVLAIAQARVQAERIADQAAVLAAERRPIPDALRSRASIRLQGTVLTVSVPLAVALPGAPTAASVTTRIAP